MALFSLYVPVFGHQRLILKRIPRKFGFSIPDQGVRNATVEPNNASRYACDPSFFISCRFLSDSVSKCRRRETAARSTGAAQRLFRNAA